MLANCCYIERHEAKGKLQVRLVPFNPCVDSTAERTSANIVIDLVVKEFNSR